MKADPIHDTEISRLRAELERERREHRETLMLLDAVTVARNRAEAALERRHRRSRLSCGRTWSLAERA